MVDLAAGIAVGYDSGNGVLAGFDVATLERRWQRDQDHGSHLLLYERSGELVTGDGPDVVVLDIATGRELRACRHRQRHAVGAVPGPRTGAGPVPLLVPHRQPDRGHEVVTFDMP